MRGGGVTCSKDFPVTVCTVCGCADEVSADAVSADACMGKRSSSVVVHRICRSPLHEELGHGARPFDLLGVPQ